jgi:hypothetical protein
VIVMAMASPLRKHWGSGHIDQLKNNLTLKGLKTLMASVEPLRRTETVSMR